MATNWLPTLFVLGVVVVVTVTGQQEQNGTSEEEQVTGPSLTGNPQIDYVWDPNLPRELNGYNLSAYPFYSTVPAKMEFDCDQLHDGFYADVAHECQVYHHCLGGFRQDFLCANYTMFDQKTFICNFAHVVDCKNSAKYWNRNDDLYKATTTTSTTTPQPITVYIERQRFSDARRRRPNGGRRRRPQRPVYDDDYYDDYDYDNDYDYQDDNVATTTTTTTTEAELAGPPVLNLAPVRTRPGGSRFSSRPDIFSVRRPSPRIRPPVPTGVASASPPSDDGADKPLSVRHLAAISRTNTHRVPSSGRFWN